MGAPHPSHGCSPVVPAPLRTLLLSRPLSRKPSPGLKPHIIHFTGRERAREGREEMELFRGSRCVPLGFGRSSGFVAEQLRADLYFPSQEWTIFLAYLQFPKVLHTNQ